MANLKDDLDQYLLLQSEQKKKFNVKMPQMKVPEFGKMFSRNAEPEANSWLKDTQDSCCPKLVSRVLYKNVIETKAFRKLIKHPFVSFYSSPPSLPPINYEWFSHDYNALSALWPV